MGVFAKDAKDGSARAGEAVGFPAQASGEIGEILPATLGMLMHGARSMQKDAADAEDGITGAVAGEIISAGGGALLAVLRCGVPRSGVVVACRWYESGRSTSW